METTGNVVIGHTTEASARIWVRGDERHRAARVRVRADAEGGESEAVLEERTDLAPQRDYTAVVSIGPLRPETPYTVLAEFAPSERALARGRGVISTKGSFRTFPPPGEARPFSFLHGSCNLSIVSLTNLGSLALGVLGLKMATGSLERPTPGGWRRLFRVADGLAWLVHQAILLWGAVREVPQRPPSRTRVASGSEKPKPAGVPFLSGVFALVLKVTGYKQSKPVLPSPFRALSERLGLAEERPAFMIHAGDQIYFDVPFPKREPKLDSYRLAYREAFFEDEDQRRFLASCPHYMALDDHELVDGFALDHVAPTALAPDPQAYRPHALEAYREYVQGRHPTPLEGPLWYEFQYGASHFLVLDTRTERRREAHQMLGAQQMRRLEEWLKQRKDEIKFVVSSVPFLAELRATAPKRGPSSAQDEREDKWTGEWFRGQRDRLVELVHQHEIRRLVFLVGDMHCAYHASMRIGTTERRSTIHELAGGPIHQLEFSRRGAFHDDFRGRTAGEKIPFRTQMRAFHGAAPGVLQVTVRPKERPELLWSVVRTSRRGGAASESRPLCGRIDL